MNIAYFSTKTNTNLVINQVIRLIKEIHDSGINIILYSFEDDGEDYSVVHKFLHDNGLPFHGITDRTEGEKLGRLRNLIEHDRIHIVHCRSYDMTIIAAAHFGFLKIIFDVRSLLPYEIFQIKNNQVELQQNLAGERKLVDLSDAVVCVTRGMVDYFVEQYGPVVKDKTVEIPNHYCHYKRWGDKSPLSAQRLSEACKWIIFAGSLTAYYRLENIFKLFHQLRERDEKYKLLLLSNQDVHKNEVLAYLNFNIDPELFEICNVAPEVVPYYLSCSRVGLNPYFSTVDVMNRVLGVKTVEYIKHDLPIVGPDYWPAYNDLKKMGYPILVFNKNFEIDFSDYEHFIAIKPDPSIKERYDIKNTGEMYIELYRRLMAGR